MTRIALWCVLGVTVCAFAWVGTRGALAAYHLQKAQTAAGALQRTVLSSPEESQPALNAIEEDTAAAYALTHDPVWRVTEGLPWVGPHLAAVSTAAASLNDVVLNVAGPLAEVAPNALQAMTPSGGAFDVDTLAALGADARAAANAARSSSDALAAVNEDILVAPLASVMSKADDTMATLAGATEALANAVELLPPMLGAEGPRDYLVVFQNDAEWRSLGGLTGSLLQMHTDNGAVTIWDQSSATSMTQYPKPILDLGTDLASIYDGKPARFAHNLTQIPDFALDAEIAREFWSRDKNVDVNGVLSLDTTALSYLLDATGPVQLETGDTLTSDNAVSLLLNEVYARYPEPADQDRFFESATSAVFEKLLSGAAKPSALLSALQKAGSEHRLHIWNAEPEEQSVLDDTTLQGQLPTSNATKSSFGVYFNDGTGSKLDYFMNAGANAQWCQRVSGGNSSAALHVEVSSEVPADVASLPAYVTGVGAPGSGIGRNGLSVGGTQPGVARTVTYVYLPEGALLSDVEASSGTATEVGFHDGRRVVLWDVNIAPGETATLDLTTNTPTGPELGVQMTPVLNEIDPSQLAVSCPDVP
ncbi:DUF4012 domain-containing protein [Microbacterium oryzae]|uniref:DUF4012 domain-containing protein n=1 Tax=Microbacterium oryzae TaxID=743009 RepID=UPI0025B1BCF4|nr:DUF4012 domain-containing protein [Microbacterium oryzae]MDN3311637.1 DUF4012 domain-containing protein [Microbacterium oryzae]